MAGLKRLSTRQGTRPGIRLWTTKQTPFLQGSTPISNFNPGSITFTRKMAIRDAPGPFTAAPIFQGDWTGEAGNGDYLTTANSTVISGAFTSLHDRNQGTLVCWIRPEQIADGKHHYYGIIPGAAMVFEKISNNSLQLRIWDGSSFRGPARSVSGWSPGTTYLVIIRWDLKNTLDGTNHFCISFYDDHAFGMSSTPNIVPSASGPWRLGGYIGQQAADAILGCYMIYRRPLWDGAYGIDAGNGDEVARIAADEDPCMVTGSWDVCFCLPTNSTVGQIVTGTGNAWSHPHSSNLLGAGGFMMDGTYTNDGWADEGTPTAVAALATAEMIFYGGYKVTSDAANEGIYKDYTCSAGDNFVIRAIGHSDGTSVPKAILYDQDNTTEIGSLTGSTASTRTAPDIFIFTGQAPAGCTTLRVKLINTDATADDITYWHQCELLNNLLSNPSFETGAGNPWVPTGWTNQNIDADDSEAEAITVHSGAGSIQFNTGASWEYMYDSNPLTIGKFFCMGGWTYGDGANGYLRIMPNMGADALIQYSPTAFYIASPTTASWSLTQGVWRNVSGGGQAHLMPSSSATGERFADDYFLFGLDDVSLNIYPASETNCTEPQGIRVVGRTECTAPLANLTTKKGIVRITVTPRHNSGDFAKFSGVAQYPTFADIYYDTNNYIIVRSAGNYNLEIVSSIDGEGKTSASWNSTGFIDAGTTYLFEIEWDLPSLIKCSIDGTQRLTITTHTKIFAQAPNLLYVGLYHYQLARQFDAVFGSPT